MTTFLKDPQAVIDFSVDWTRWVPEGDVITSSTWRAQDGLTIEGAPAPALAGAVTTVWLSGGTAHRTYWVANQVETAAGRTDERSFRVAVYDR